MKNLAIPILVALIFIVMGIYLVTYQVRETESVFITRFGKPVRDQNEPGLGWKWPTPIEQVHRFDARMRVLESNRLSETPTRGSTPIIVNTYIVWRVAEPLKFLTAVRTVAEAESKLRAQINDTQNRIIGQHWFGDFVNSDPNRVMLDRIQNDMLADLQEPVRREYGIEIKTLGIKQLKVSEDVTKSVFDRMRADRKRRTDTTISEGQAQADKIRAEANNKRDVLLAAAEALGKAIRGDGDAQAAKYYEMLEQAPDLAIFLRTLEALRTMLGERTTLVLPADSEALKYLKEMPALEPQD
ncbi:MAG: protease modulator HflC [Sedimentisphaerales bacterium]|nr:protease modulator HflC [Sedimentisphaerales bacterium]